MFLKRGDTGKEVEEGLMLVEDLVEKPEPNLAPSLLGIQGRYVFTSDLFNHLRMTKSGAGDETL